MGDPVPVVYKSCDYLLSDTVDTDGDGVADRFDAYPADTSESIDTDGDGLGDYFDPFPNDANNSGNWISCAREGATCNVLATAMTRYGASGQYHYEQVSGSIACTNSAFGGDPVPFIHKFCSYLLSSNDSDGDGVADNLDAFPNDPLESDDTDGDGLGDNFDPFPNDAENNNAWVYCADENQTCTVPNTAVVRYGANDQFAYQTISDSTVCSNEIFGDPIFLVFKACAYLVGNEVTPPAPTTAAIPTLSYTPVKGITLNWTDEADATFYRVLENPDGSSGFTQVGGDIPQGTGTNTKVVALYKRVNARYILQTCNESGCIDANEVSVSSILLTNSIGYFKASHPDTFDVFGWSFSLSNDGNTLAIGARNEDSNATGINGDQTDNSSNDAGAVYVFSRSSNNVWDQQACLKASNTGTGDRFGSAVSLSDNGNTLAVGASSEDSNATGINGNQANNSKSTSGAVYLFIRSNNTWNQQAYIKASNTDIQDIFGTLVNLSGDGNTLAVSAPFEQSNATGIDGDQTNNGANRSGAVYVFGRSDNTWSQQAYVKASNAEAEDFFGISINLTTDGNTLAIGAPFEDSNTTGIDGDQANNDANNSGAVYVFNRSGNICSQQAYIKSSNTEAHDLFGDSVHLSGDGNNLVIGASSEDSNTTGIDGDQTNNNAGGSGAVHIFGRSSSLWNQENYIKSSNTDANDCFGRFVMFSADGNTLAVGSHGESSNTTGINGDQTNNNAGASGAVYLY